MLRYFWSDNSVIPPELYTRNFSPAHIGVIALLLLLITATLVIYRAQRPLVKERIKKTLVVLMVASESSVWLWQASNGTYNMQYSLPLHLCDLSVFLEYAAVYNKRSTLLKEFAYALSMPAALSAIITPGWYYPLLSFQYIEMMAIHALLVLIPVLFVWGDGFNPSWRRLPKVSVLLVVFIAAAVVANYLLKSNYMFLSYVPKDTALVIFETWFGDPGYLLPELALLLLVWTALYLPRSINSRRSG